ncbi:MAG TPA: Ig-like domain-containing protein [Gemmatimonadales bacterium]|nr:Ig-like domain-containing protein [Gemmatimonadales bacterium]
MRSRALALLGTSLLCTACGDSLTLPNTGPAGPSKLSLATKPPAEAVAGEPLSPAIRIQMQDATGAPIEEAGRAVTASLQGDTGAQLRGQLTQATDSNGVAAFGDLAIDGPARSYTIEFSSAGLTPATTPPIAVTVPLIITTATIRSITPARGTALAPVTVTFDVTADHGGTPSGSVSVSDGTDGCTATVSAGRCEFTPTTGGDKTITVSYGGDARFQSSRATKAYRIERVATSIVAPDVQPSRLIARNSSVTFRTQVAAAQGSIRGPVTFNRDGCGSNGTPLDDPVSVRPDGTAELTTSIDRTGIVSIAACFTGTPTFAPAASELVAIWVVPANP